MNLTVTDQEAQLLIRILKIDLGDMKMETGKTENYDWRIELKKDEETLRDIISRLSGSTVS